MLGDGNVQEEIMFTIKPECLIGMMFCETMNDSEAIIISNPVQFADYSGYGSNFNFVREVDVMKE